MEDKRRDEIIKKAGVAVMNWTHTTDPRSISEFTTDFALKIVDEQTREIQEENAKLKAIIDYSGSNVQRIAELESRLKDAEGIIDSIPKTWFMQDIERKAKLYRAKYPKPKPCKSTTDDWKITGVETNG